MPASVRPRRLLATASVVAAAILASALPAAAGPLGSEPVALASAGGFGYFWATSKNHGFELWRTDGTAAGTKIYQEFQPGAAGIEGGRVQLVDGRLWVYASDGVRGIEPFRIDPATGKRSLLKDINPGSVGSGDDFASEYLFVAIGGRVIFPADDGTHGHEWWATTGTKASTRLLADASSDESWIPQWYAKVGGTLLFDALRSGHEGWATDGTPAGTAKLVDHYIGDQSYRPALVVNGWAIMNGAATNESELWRSDGTTVELLKEINPTGYSQPNGFIRLNGKILFSADDGFHGTELWTTNGTADGTTRISDINTSGNSTIGVGRADNQPARLGTTVFFIANDGSGEELWKTNGATVSRVKDINPTGGSDPRELVVSGGKLFFRATDGSHGTELWVSDGTKAGTRMLKDINPAGDGFVGDIVALKNGRVLFTADDGVTGWEPWVSDGTKAGTKLLKDIR